MLKAQKAHKRRPATGSIVWDDPERRAKPRGVRVTMACGKRKVIRFDPDTSPENAVVLGPVIAAHARSAAAAAGETVFEYAARWCAWRASRGLSCAAGDMARLERHVLPTIGQLPVASVNRKDLKRLVMVLNDRVAQGFTVDQEGRRRPLAWKTAIHAWNTVRRRPPAPRSRFYASPHQGTTGNVTERLQSPPTPLCS
jgi:hypothetical protein